MKTILISGATGFIAQNFINRFSGKYSFVKLSHAPISGHITFKDLQDNDYLIKQIDVILNLAGTNIGHKRWSNQRKHELLDSRIKTTAALVDIFNSHGHVPHLISASAISVYGGGGVNSEGIPVKCDKYSSFSQEITNCWELEALKYKGLTTIARFAVVLSSVGGAFPNMVKLFKLGFGGKLGNGEQMFSWIALEDLLSALEMIIDKKYAGAFNLSALQPVTNKELTASIGRVWHKRTPFKIPVWLIKLFLGQMGQELLLNSYRAMPGKLLEIGFRFKYPNLSDCLTAIKNGNF